ncbi:MAG TPA: hypothetical protein VFF40_06130 [Acidimicrobiia bacterium]|nr:hypothetical protein [Acidimicrobiia bacterium]
MSTNEPPVGGDQPLTPPADPARLTVSSDDVLPVPGVSPADSAEQIILTIGDIGVSPHWVVTPNGTAPLHGSQWIARDMSTTEQKIPAWAIILAILFALLCLIGLFFLLVKETKTRGYVEVTVQAEGLYHATQIPVSSADHVAQVRYQVAQAQSMGARA